MTDRPHKPYGIEVRLPPGDPMAAPHLLGENWVTTRWYETAEARDRALAEMRRQPRYYRVGDTPSIELRAIDP